MQYLKDLLHLLYTNVCLGESSLFYCVSRCCRRKLMARCCVLFEILVNDARVRPASIESGRFPGYQVV